MPTRVLIHRPNPEPPQLVERPDHRPARGEQFPTGWMVADYNLAIGEWHGQPIAWEAWVVPWTDADDRSGGEHSSSSGSEAASHRAESAA